MTDDTPDSAAEQGASPTAGNKLDFRGYPVRAAIWLVDFIGKWSSILTGFYTAKDYAPGGLELACRIRQRRRVDNVTILWWILPFHLWWLITQCTPSWWWLKVPAIVVLALRIVNIVSYNLRCAVIEEGPDPGARLLSLRRSLVLGLINYLELIVCFAGIYASQPSVLVALDVSSRDWVSPLYFSAITQLAIGYGDLTPSHWARVVSCLQCILGLLLVVMTIGRLSATLRVTDMESRKGGFGQNN